MFFLNTFTFYIDGDPLKKVDFEVKRVLNGGWAARNQADLKKHIQELAELGIAGPKEIPTFYPLLANKLCLDNELEVMGTGNSGEVEFVILYTPQGLLVGLGSDHTDRDLEKFSIPKAKLSYPNIMSSHVWHYEDIIDHWDELEMHSSIGLNGDILYQSGTLADLMRPEELMAKAEALINEDPVGTVLYSGCLPILGDIRFNEHFHMELVDKVRNQKISHCYHIKTVNWFKGEVE